MLEPAGVGRAICTILSSRSPRMDWLDVLGAASFSRGTLLPVGPALPFTHKFS
jgi:hypothetical protein